VRLRDPLLQLGHVQPALAEGSVQPLDDLLTLRITGPQRVPRRRTAARVLRSCHAYHSSSATRVDAARATAPPAPAQAVRTAAVPPYSASLAAPPSSAVSTQGPSGVMAMVCSKCAAYEPSTVTTVHPSASSRVAAPAIVIIGSIARQRPATSRGPRPGRPSVSAS